MGHQNRMRDALGLTSDRVYQLRSKEYCPKIVYIKGIDNTMSDTISRLNFTLKSALPEQTEQQTWMTVTKCWCNCSGDIRTQQ